MRLYLPEPLLAEIQRHAEATYPEECCGFLVAALGADGPDEPRRICRVARMENRMLAARGRRFVIPPDELRQFEQSLKGTGEALVGFYHSHPDHPAIPSLFDQEHAWPWYTYLILAVDHGKAGTLGAFELNADDRRFLPVTWSSEPGRLAAR